MTDNRNTAAEIRRNLMIGWIQGGFFSVASVLTSGAVLQALFMKLGMDARTISLYASFTQAFYLLFSVIAAGFANRIPNIRRKISALYFIQAAVMAANLVFCFMADASPTLLCVTAFLLGALANIVNTIRVTVAYRMTYFVINTEDYAHSNAVSGIVSGALSILPGLFLPFFYRVFGYYETTIAVFLIAAVFCAAAGGMNLQQHFIRTEPPVKEKKTASSYTTADLFRDRDFLVMIVPNFLRGFGTGFLSLITVLSISYAGYTEENAVILSSLSQIATFLGCALYGLFRRKKLSPALLGLVGAGMFCLLAVSFSGSPVWFGIVYLIAYIGYNTVSYIIPEIIYLMTDETKISLHQTWRMAFTTLGTIVSTALIGVLIDHVDGRLLVLFSVPCLLVCCLAYYLRYKKIQ